jgi:hypothetical protein
MVRIVKCSRYAEVHYIQSEQTVSTYFHYIPCRFKTITKQKPANYFKMNNIFQRLHSRLPLFLSLDWHTSWHLRPDVQVALVVGRVHHSAATEPLFRVVFWDILPCKIIVDRRFRGAYCLHHQDEHHTRRRENLKSHTEPLCSELGTLLLQRLIVFRKIDIKPLTYVDFKRRYLNDIYIYII